MQGSQSILICSKSSWPSLGVQAMWSQLWQFSLVVYSWPMLGSFRETMSTYWFRIFDIPERGREGGGVEFKISFVSYIFFIFVPCLHEYKLLKFSDSGAMTHSMKWDLLYQSFKLVYAVILTSCSTLIKNANKKK